MSDDPLGPVNPLTPYRLTEVPNVPGDGCKRVALLPALTVLLVFWALSEVLSLGPLPVLAL